MAATADFFLIPALDRDRSVAKGLPFGSNVVVENPLPAVLACSATAPGAPKKKLRARMCAKPVVPGEFVPAKHFYPKVLPATIHPQVASFLALSNEQIAAIFCARNPEVDMDELVSILNTGPKYFRWAGSDLFNAKNIDGKQQMIIVETNSCPSGQKSMPPVDAGNKSCGYLNVIKTAFKEVEESVEKSLGGLAVVCDKNMMEASGYAAAMADFFNEKVHLAEYFVDDLDPPVKWESNLMYIRDAEDVWHPIRACFRYVTQKPWNRFPLSSRTAILNSTIACLSGGRNKLMAAQAYDSFNDEVAPCGVGLRIPETIQNVSKSEIPAWLERMGGHAVIKVPYSNAGQGVYTITNKKELDEFMDENHHYEKFIVQALVGAPSWKTTHRPNSFFHAGNFVADLRMMVTGCASGFRPAAMYARRARQPIPERLEDQPDVASWDILGTNLSVKLDNGDWTTETERLVIMDTAEFESLQLSTYNLCDAYIQTVFSVLAIDRMCQALMAPNGHGGRSFDLLKFGSRNPDDVLVNEIVL